MERYNRGAGAASAPTPPSAPVNPYYAEGNPGLGVPATQPGPWWFHMITEEMRKVITDAGLTPDHTNLTQLSAAIQAMITASLAPDASETVKGIIEIATAAEAQAFAADKAIDGAKLAAALQGANQSFIAAGGYQKLPGGFIIQWGSRGMATAGDGSFPVTFPLTFPNGVLHASWTVQAGSLTQNVGTNISNITTSGMDLIVDKDASQSTTFTGLWFTFGY